MKRSTVARGISERPANGGDVAESVRRLQKHAKAPFERVDEGDLVTVFNDEALPVLRELRTKANLDLREKGTAATAGAGAWTEVWRSPELETNGTYGLSAVINWSNDAQTVWARATVNNVIVSASGVVSITTADAGDIWASSGAIPNPRWTADAANRQAVLEFADDGATVMTAAAVVTMSAREL